MGMPLSGDCKIKFQRVAEEFGVRDKMAGKLTEQIIRRGTRFCLDLRDRLEMALARLSGRFGSADERRIVISPELSELDVAEMIVSSRPMVSRPVVAMADW